jgi:hypothetical protein
LEYWGVYWVPIWAYQLPILKLKWLIGQIPHHIHLLRSQLLLLYQLDDDKLQLQSLIGELAINQDPVDIVVCDFALVYG